MTSAPLVLPTAARIAAPAPLELALLPDGGARPDAPARPPPLPAPPFQHWIALGDAVPAPEAALPADAAPAEPAAPPDALLAAMAPPLTPPMPMAPAALPVAPPAAADAAAAADAVPTPAVVPTTETATETAPRRAAAAPAPAVKAAATATAPETVPPDGAPAAPAPGDAIAAPPPPARGAPPLVLAGPPTAWRQGLRDALGERLQLQLGRGVEQATIRLEPPQLGRIDISVRHSGGHLEVRIAATNTEVVRQLNTVGDSLRGDLAGRQYASVSVSVGEAPRAQAGHQPGNPPSGQPGADAQGRGARQDGQRRQRAPGLALADAGAAGAPFSMTD